MWKLTQRFGKWPRYWEMAQIHGTGRKYFRNSFTMLKMALEFDKRFKYVVNDVYIFEMAQVFEKRLNYVGNDLDLWEMVQICGEMT